MSASFLDSVTAGREETPNFVKSIEQRVLRH